MWCALFEPSFRAGNTLLKCSTARFHKAIDWCSQTMPNGHHRSNVPRFARGILCNLHSL